MRQSGSGLERLGEDFDEKYFGRFFDIYKIGTLVQDRISKNYGIIVKDFSCDFSCSRYIEVLWMKENQFEQFYSYCTIDYYCEAISVGQKKL